MSIYPLTYQSIIYLLLSTSNSHQSITIYLPEYLSVYHLFIHNLYHSSMSLFACLSAFICFVLPVLQFPHLAFCIHGMVVPTPWLPWSSWILCILSMASPDSDQAPSILLVCWFIFQGFPAYSRCSPSEVNFVVLAVCSSSHIFSYSYKA